MATKYAIAGGAGLQDGTSAANAWSLGEASKNAAAGDTVRLCGDFSCGDWDDGGGNDYFMPDNAGTRNSWIQWIGYNAAGDTKARVTIDGNGSDVGGALGAGIGSLFYHYFEGIDFTDDEGIPVTIGANPCRTMFISCTIKTGSAQGIVVPGDYLSWTVLIDCEISGNTTHGIDASDVGLGTLLVKGCSIHDNGSDGITVASNATILYNLVYENGNYGISAIETANTSILIEHNTIDSNGDDGIYINSIAEGITAIDNNIITENVEYGIDNADASTVIIGFANLIPGGSGGADSNGDGSTDDVVWLGDVITANMVDSEIADFTDESGSDADFALGGNSDAAGAGWPGEFRGGDNSTGTMDMGAVMNEGATPTGLADEGEEWAIKVLLSEEASVPINFEIGLATASPDEDDSEGDIAEVTGTGYSRQTVASNNADWQASFGGDNDWISYAKAQYIAGASDWDPASHWFLLTKPAVGDQKLVAYGALDNTRTLTSGQSMILTLTLRAR